MSDTRRLFKIAAAQIGSIRGDVAANVARHEAAIRAAAANGVSVVVFPELSLVGYEPDIAASLAFTDDDIRLEPLRRLILEHHLTTLNTARLLISQGGHGSAGAPRPPLVHKPCG